MTLKEKVAEIMPEKIGEDYVTDTNVATKNIKIGAKWWDEEEDITFIITNIDGNNVKFEYDDCIGSMPKKYLLTHCKYIEDYVADTNAGNKNEITLQEAKIKEIMKQLWQETENVLGHEMVDFYSIERIIRDVFGMDNSEEESK